MVSSYFIRLLFIPLVTSFRKFNGVYISESSSEELEEEEEVSCGGSPAYSDYSIVFIMRRTPTVFVPVGINSLGGLLYLSMSDIYLGFFIFIDLF